MASNDRSAERGRAVARASAGQARDDGITNRRPPRVYQALLEELSARALREMWEVVMNPDHPWHAEHGPKILRDLVRICTPRIGHVGVFQANDAMEMIEPQPSMAELFDSKEYGGATDQS